MAVRNVPCPVTHAQGIDFANRSAAIAREALQTGGSVYDLEPAEGRLTREKLDDFLNPDGDWLCPLAIPREVSY